MSNADLLDEHPSLRFDERLGTLESDLETPKPIEDEVEMADEFPGNSQRRVAAKAEPAKKAPEKKVEKVVSGEVVRRKQPLGKRIRSVFMGGDSQSVKDYVLLEVLIPALKDTITDAVTGGIERMVFGDNVRPGRRGSRYSGPSVQTNYAGISNRGAPAGAPGRYREDPRNQLSRRARSQHDFDEIVFPTRADAEAVRSQMFELLDQFEVVTVSDFYELVGVSGDFPDHKYGWTDLRTTDIYRARGGGHVIGLPPTEPID